MPKYVVLPFVAALLAVALLVPIGRTALAGPDISGDWTSYATGDVSGACANTFAVDGTAVRAEIDCDIVGRGILVGTIDASGRFAIEGTPGGILLQVEGTLSSDGHSISGTWAAPEVGFSGTFTGERGKLIRPAAEQPVAPRRHGPVPVPLSAASTIDFHEPFRSLGGATRPSAPDGLLGLREAELSPDEPDGGQDRTLASLASVGLIGTVLLGFFLRTRQA